MKRCILFTLLLLALSSSVGAAELTIESGAQKKIFTTAQLLKMPGVKKIKVEKDPAYPDKAYTYTAVPAASLFEGVKLDPKGTLQFHCTDGFAAPISIPRLLNQDPRASVAYLAIEGKEKWPKLRGGKKTAGPFYLIWEKPELSNVGTEEWPFQLDGFKWQLSVAELYPHTAPDAKLLGNSPEQKGYLVFQKNCFVCHRVNGEGASEMGPDLNIPFNPTEYFQAGYLLKLVRNPQNLRKWPQSKMTSFNEAALSEADFKDLEAYLRHMAGRKVKGN
jgi:mono/diheme cytochrome c family protein